MASVLELDAGKWQEEVLDSDVLTVVDFWHDHCPWCLKLNPVFSEVAEEYNDRIKFAKLNVLETSANRMTAINLGIMSTPTLMFFCEGRSVGQHLGFMPKEQMRQVLDDMMEKHRNCIRQSTPLDK